MSGEHTGPEADAAPESGRRRDRLVVVLAIGAGAADVTAFVVLGKVFSSVITGNLVLLGLAAASATPGLALRSGIALVAYAAGVLIGAPIAARGRRLAWPPAVTAALGVELCLLLGFTAGWEAARHQPDWRLVLLALLAAAMGVQSAAVGQLGHMSSTYMTGTLTGVLAGLVTRGHQAGRWRDAAAAAAVLAGAGAGELLILFAPDWLPALTLLPLATVIAVASRHRRPAADGS
jgi:uncharacterized membrane protein YoaK (UPF0700 family)